MIIVGNATVQRYLVDPDAAQNFDEAKLAKNMEAFAFKPIDDKKGGVESQGWANPFDVVYGKMGSADLVAGDRTVILGVRKDKKSIPSVIFKARLKESHRLARANSKNGKLTREGKANLKQKLTTEMLKETSPTTAVTDAVWLVDEGVLLVGATGAAAQRLVDLFEATFETRVTQAYPGILIGRAFDEDPKLKTAFEEDCVKNEIPSSLGFNVEQVDRFRVWANHFLTWLVRQDGSFGHREVGDICFSIGDAIFMTDRDGEAVVRLSNDENFGDVEEDFEYHLSMRKLVSFMKFNMINGDVTNIWKGAVDNDFVLRGLKLPVPKQEGDTPEREMTALRAASINEAFSSLDQLLLAFLRERLGGQWYLEDQPWRKA
jgi:acetone carboxylase gamma subunit